MKNERKELLETGQSKSNLSAERQQELIETGKLKKMDGHHEPLVSSGKIIEEKVEIAKNPDNITFMEKPDHQATHAQNGGTQVPISKSGDAVTSTLVGIAVILEGASEVADHIPDVTSLFQQGIAALEAFPESGKGRGT